MEYGTTSHKYPGFDEIDLLIPKVGYSFMLVIKLDI